MSISIIAMDGVGNDGWSCQIVGSTCRLSRSRGDDGVGSGGRSSRSRGIYDERVDGGGGRGHCGGGGG